MESRHIRLRATTDEHPADFLDRRDEDVMQALATAGALVALADGRVDAVERDELVNFIDRQGLVPTISNDEVAGAFDNLVRELEARDRLSVILDAFRPLAGLSLASVVVRTAERVACADGKILPGELQALRLIRLLMATLPDTRPGAAFRAL
jgi:tellurite resistance protein TerB